MNDNIEHITDLFLNHFGGEDTPEEQAELREWLSVSEENRKLFREYREIWLCSSRNASPRQWNAADAFNTFKSTVMLPPPKRKTFFSYIWKPAIALAAASVAILLSFNMGKQKMQETFADIVVEVPQGSSSRLVLPDSTEVWLNSGSTIRYSQGFGVRDRKVSLSGEGHFKVSKDPSRPFSVQTDELLLTVLGTSFNFRNYRNDAELVVCLEEGRVSLINKLKNEEEKFLDPDNRYVLDKRTGIGGIQSVSSSKEASWTRGRLYFNEALLTDIAKALERCYNVEITIEGEDLKDSRFYGDFSRSDQGIDEIIEALSSTGRLNSSREGKHITLY